MKYACQNMCWDFWCDAPIQLGNKFIITKNIFLCYTCLSNYRCLAKSMHYPSEAGLMDKYINHSYTRFTFFQYPLQNQSQRTNYRSKLIVSRTLLCSRFIITGTITWSTQECNFCEAASFSLSRIICLQTNVDKCIYQVCILYALRSFSFAC